MTDTKPNAVDIAPFGDAVLVVGAERVRLRVHSLLLRTSSTVFDAMLGPSYSEGTNLSSVSPKDISLPEDDAGALEVIFNVLHYRMDAIDDPPDPCLILRIAIMADKYDFIQALKLATRDWLKCDTIKDGQRLWKLAIASCWLRNDKGFQNSTRALLYHYGGSYVKLGELDKMPPDVLSQFPALMEERRAQLRMDLMFQFILIGPSMKPYASCNCAKIRGMDYLQHILGSYSLAPGGSVRPWRAGTLQANRVSQIAIADVIASMSAQSIEMSTDLGCKHRLSHTDHVGFGDRICEAVKESKIISTDYLFLMFSLKTATRPTWKNWTSRNPESTGVSKSS